MSIFLILASISLIFMLLKEKTLLVTFSLIFCMFGCCLYFSKISKIRLSLFTLFGMSLHSLFLILLLVVFGPVMSKFFTASVKKVFKVSATSFSLLILCFFQLELFYVCFFVLLRRKALHMPRTFYCLQYW